MQAIVPAEARYVFMLVGDSSSTSIEPSSRCETQCCSNLPPSEYAHDDDVIYMAGEDGLLNDGDWLADVQIACYCYVATSSM